MTSTNSANPSSNNRSYSDGIITQDSKNESNGDNEQITFINYARNYCVCFVDIVDSTKSTCEITESKKIQEYYSVFLNTMASIIRNHNGHAIKNSGDSLLYYFPRTFDSKNEVAFQDVINCGMAMIKQNEILNRYYNKNGLSSISYRISANYGRAELAVSLNSNNVDLFGSSVNTCSKINHLACPNQMIIHKDLHEVLKKMTFYKQYIFRELNDNPTEHGNSNNNFLVYSVDLAEHQVINSKKIERNQNTQSFVNKQDQSNSSLNILLIDDDRDILFAFKSLIQNEGYKVDTFSNPFEALSHFSHVHPYFYNLIIMDIRMPELNGIKLYSKLKLINPDIRVLFLSALNAIDEVLSIFPEIKHGEIIRKPIEPAILLSKVESRMQY